MGEKSNTSNPPIKAYHAHVYYEPSTKDRAASLRDEVAARFRDFRLGRWHDAPVGPHTRAMYQILFGPDRFTDFLPWLMLNRQGLAILVHPETGNEYKDHAEHALWLGEMLPLRLDVLEGPK
jgi:aromatic ring-cleaving dioxygenase